MCADEAKYYNGRALLDIESPKISRNIDAPVALVLALKGMVSQDGVVFIRYEYSLSFYELFLEFTW